MEKDNGVLLRRVERTKSGFRNFTNWTIIFACYGYFRDKLNQKEEGAKPIYWRIKEIHLVVVRGNFSRGIIIMRWVYDEYFKDHYNTRERFV